MGVDYNSFFLNSAVKNSRGLSIKEIYFQISKSCCYSNALITLLNLE